MIAARLRCDPCEQGLGGRTLQSLRNLPLQELLRHIEELSRELHGLKGDCKPSSSLRIWNESSQRAQDPRPSAVESYRFERCVIQGCVIQAAPSSAITGMSCRLYKQQLKAVMKQMTYTKSNINTAPEAGHVSDGAPKGSLRHADIT